jgi:lysophospholipase L1-like esterase
MNSKTKNILAIVGISVIVIGITSFIVIRNRKKKRLNCKDKILFLGNSQTANKNSYVERLQKHCTNTDFTKIAKVGAKSDWILQQFKDEIKKGNKYDWVSVMIGGNDIFARKSIDKTKNNLAELFELAKKNKIKVLVMSSPTKLYYSRTTPKHLALADELEEWLEENKNVNKFIPITKLTENKDLFASDMLHINSKGQELIFKELLKKGGFR